MTLKNWQQHEEILIAFEDAWQSGSPPSVKDEITRFSGSDQIHLLAELVMIDFEHRCRRGQQTNLESYFSSFPELREPEWQATLMAHELKIRRKTNASPTQAEIDSRFPDDTSINELHTTKEPTPNQERHIASLLEPGMRVDGYQIVEQIGTGAFATVYSAVDVKLSRVAALKFLSRVGGRATDLRKRMLREAKAVASLRHPNVVPVYGAGNFQGHDYIASQLVQGKTLDAVLQSPMSVRRSAEIIKQLASALDEFHRAGVIHRDIKPTNVMLEKDVPLLLDFGLAHLVDDSLGLTNEGDVVGTPAFMPPEQADGRAWQADPRSDIYSLGALLFRMLCGRPPFEGTTAAVIHQVLHANPSIPHNVRREIGEDLHTIVSKCLRKEPSQRYQTALELSEDLNRFLDGRPILSRPIGWVGRMANWAWRRPGVAGLATSIIFLSLFLGGGATQLWRVAQQRDRAQLAEGEIKKLLASSVANAGFLAMQRGRIADAVEHFTQSLNGGYSDPTRIHLSLVEANFILRDLDAATESLIQAVDTDTPMRYESEVAMWKTELALEGILRFGTSEDLLLELSTMSLSTEDAHYVEGLRSASSPEAVTCFQKSLAENPFHYRARRMLNLLLLSLARFEDAQDELRIARQLYPEDQDFLLLESLTLAARADLPTATQLIADSKLADQTKTDWTAFCRELYQIVNESNYEYAIAQVNSEALVQLAKRFEVLHPLIESRRWRLPPNIGKQFTKLSRQLRLILDGDTVQVHTIEELVSVHPEASLYLVEASLRLTDVSATERGEEQAAMLEKSLAAFQQSLNYPGYFGSSQQFSWKGVFLSSMMLALVHQRDVEANQKIYTEASRQVDHSVIQDPGSVRAFAIAALTSRDIEESERWIRHWQTLEMNDERRVDAMWHLAVQQGRKKDWIGVVDTCEKILKIAPSNKAATARLAEARNHLANALGDQDLEE